MKLSSAIRAAAAGGGLALLVGCTATSGSGPSLALSSTATAVTVSSARVSTLDGRVDLPVLPLPVSNNAVAAINLSADHYRLYSFSGLLEGRTWRDVTDRAFEYDSQRASWVELGPVPGGVGRLASTAQVIANQVYVIGGYTVAEDGGEVSTPEIHRFDSSSGQYTDVTRMPVPVDDAVSGVYRDRYLYLVSGWHDTDNVDLVQVFDTHTGSWLQATPLPGPPVFGHAGGLIDDQLLICGGVKVVAGSKPGDGRRFVMSDECWRGHIDSVDPGRIAWQAISTHPGPALYRAASGPAQSASRRGIVIAGGTDNPFNYNAIGYDGVPSQARSGCHWFDPDSSAWSFDAACQPMMDQRGMVKAGGRLMTIGGMVPAP